MASAIYPGTFDPVHNGHVDIATRALAVFDRLVISVYEAPPKSVLFSTQERVGLVREAVSHLRHVEVTPFSGLSVHFARSVGARFIVRGLRAGFDFETEFEMALMWRKLAPDIDVVALMSSLEYQYVHSSRIKEVAQLGGDIRGLVPEHVALAVSSKFRALH